MAGTTKKASSKRPAVPVKAAAPAIPVVAFEQASGWSTWLESHHGSVRAVWLKIAKKGAGPRSVTYAEALDVALTWGWIDGQKGKLDETWWLQRFTPRGPRSIWSRVNREKVAALTAEGRMKEPGLVEVARAKKDGRWDAAYESQSRATVPPDLAAALKANPKAARFFETLESYNRYAVLFRVHTAKKEETRAKRIAKFIEMLARHEKVHP